MTKPVIVGISGPVLADDERKMLTLHQPRGVILFNRNIINKQQLTELTENLRNLLPDEGVVMVDQEGGRVARLRGPEWPDFPAAGTLARDETAYRRGFDLAVIARAAGFNVVAAPVLDLRHDGVTDAIGDRAISADSTVVARLGGRIAAGILDMGLIPVMKHIPGHGRAKVDSHFALPRVGQADLSADFRPFQECRHIPWAMTAHIVYEAYDALLPATLSNQVISRVIRGEIGFAGTLISDDLAMHALTGTPAERAVAALDAGCDIALYCPGDLAGNLAILEAVPHEA